MPQPIHSSMVSMCARKNEGPWTKHAALDADPVGRPADDAVVACMLDVENAIPPASISNESRATTQSANQRGQEFSISVVLERDVLVNRRPPSDVGDDEQEPRRAATNTDFIVDVLDDPIVLDIEAEGFSFDIRNVVSKDADVVYRQIPRRSSISTPVRSRQSHPPEPPQKIRNAGLDSFFHDLCEKKRRARATGEACSGETALATTTSPDVWLRNNLAMYSGKI